MDDTQNTSQPQANPEPQTTPPAQPVPPEPTPTSPTPQPVPSAVQEPMPVQTQQAPPIQTPTTGGRTFYKTFSPRLMNIPFSLAIDKNRAKMAASKKGYQIPEPPMYLSDGGMFWGNVYVEVNGAAADDTNVVTLTDEQITAKEKV